MTTIERITVGDEEPFAGFLDVYERAHDRDIDRPYSAIEKRVGLRPDDYVDTAVLLARDDAGTAVAGGIVVLPLRDNRELAYVEVFTVPERRREGHGSAVVEAAGEVVEHAGRSRLVSEPVWEMDAVDPAPQLFAEACGFRLDLMSAARELTLPAVLPPLQVAAGYALHTWRGRAPEEWVQGYTDVRQLINAEAPSGEHGLENEYWDVARTRAEEQQWAAQGRTPQVSIAVSDAGTVVGHTQLLFSSDSPEVYQWDTLVLPTDRGHGLGLALKVRTMQAAADLLRGRRRITTYNAAGNEPMIRVNEALGFHQVGWVADYVKEL